MLNRYSFPNLAITSGTRKPGSYVRLLQTIFASFFSRPVALVFAFYQVLLITSVSVEERIIYRDGARVGWERVKFDKRSDWILVS